MSEQYFHFFCVSSLFLFFAYKEKRYCTKLERPRRHFNYFVTIYIFQEYGEHTNLYIGINMFRFIHFLHKKHVINQNLRTFCGGSNQCLTCFECLEKKNFIYVYKPFFYWVHVFEFGMQYISTRPYLFLRI